MDKSMLTTFVENKIKLGSRLDILPLYHSCEGFLGIEIIKEGMLKIQKCDVFDKDLLYFFYGKPSYPVAEKFPKKRTDAYYCPICFIVNPEKVSIYEVYPFDTGAFRANKYSDFFPRGVKLEDYKLDTNIEAIQSYITVMFGDNDNYIDGRCIQVEYDIAEIDVLIRMLKPSGAFDIDERSNTVEVISNNSVDIIDAVECVILPNNIMRDRRVKDFFDKHKIKYKTYRFRPLTKPDRYYEVVFQLAMEHIYERGI